LQTIFFWKSTRYGLAETRHVVGNLADLRETIAMEFSNRILYMESRRSDIADQIVSSHLRSSADDLTEDDFHWLTATTPDELRGLRA
jgi:hypothetical protein